MLYCLAMSTVDPSAGAPVDTILLLETLAANAWPPEQLIQLDGWRLRSVCGITRRANSVRPNGGATDSGRQARYRRQFYTSPGCHRFPIGDAAQPPNLDDLLDRRDYRADAHTYVQTAAISDLLRNLPLLRLRPHFELEVSEEFDEDWFALYCVSEDVSGQAAAVRRGILQRIQPVRLCPAAQRGTARRPSAWA